MRPNVVLGVLGAMSLFGLVTAGSALARQSDPSPAQPLEGYSMHASGAAQSVVYVNPESPTGFGGNAADVRQPFSRARLVTGPSSDAIAAHVFPGELVSNADSIGAPAYPAQVEAEHPGGAAEADDSSAPGVSLHAEAAAARAVSSAQQGAADGSGLFTDSTVEVDAVATGRSFARASRIEFAGVVRIESVESIAEATSDGEAATASAGTTVAGAEVAGQAVRIDENGAHFLGEDDDPLAGPLPQANDVLAGAGIQIFLVNPVELVDGARGIAQAGGLVIRISDITRNEAGQQLLDQLPVAPPTTGEVIVTYGQAVADVAATRVFPSFTPPKGAASAPPPGAAQPTVPSGDRPSTATGATASTRPAATPTPPALVAARPISFRSAPVTIGLVAAAGLIVGGATWGLRQVYVRVFEVGR